MAGEKERERERERERESECQGNLCKQCDLMIYIFIYIAKYIIIKPILFSI